MPNRILLSAVQLNELITDKECITVDCRFDLADPAAGHKAWLEGHIPGAAYAHLDDDLSSPVEAHTGRHPLPDSEEFARFLASIGWTEDLLLVACDEGSSALAVRLWWLMRYHGKAAAVLDGGLAAWKDAGLPLEAGETVTTPSAQVVLVPDESMAVNVDRLHAQLEELSLLDARAPERFSGEVEPLDTIAGHIPGAINRPFDDNRQSNGTFMNPEELRAEFRGLLNEAGLDGVVHSCGSGVTACHNLFAMELAGLGGTRLYPGSWSEWIRDPARPIETGA